MQILLKIKRYNTGKYNFVQENYKGHNIHTPPGNYKNYNALERPENENKTNTKTNYYLSKYWPRDNNNNNNNNIDKIHR